MGNTDNNDTSHYEDALLEDIDDRLKGILEGQDSLAHVPKQLNDMDDRLRNVESDVKVIKKVVTEHSYELKAIKTRITKHERVCV